MIIVLDTNVWISGILWEGPPHDIVLLAERGKLLVASSEPLLDELFGVLAREKFQKYLVAANTNLATLREHVFSLVQLYATHEKVAVITADPPDNAVLECALAADAEVIISGDDHLLTLKQFQDIPILTPRQFLQRLN